MRSFFDAIRRSGYRRGPERVLGGIAAGIAHSLGWSVWLTRVLVLLSFALPVLGLGAYLVAWALTPWQDGRVPLESAFSASRG